MKLKRKAKWDGRRKLVVTAKFELALHELLEAELEMMKRNKFYPEDWEWGCATIEDFANSHCVALHFGDKDDHPKWFKGSTGVRVL